MAHRLWNLNRFNGNARTEYVLDAEFFNSGTAPFSAVTGTGTATVETDGTTQPRFNLGNGAGAGTSAITFTPNIFTGNILCVVLDIEGFGIVGRPAFNAYWGATTVGVGVKSDSTSTRLWSRVSGGTERGAISLAGNVTPVTVAECGFIADYQKQEMIGHMGWSMTGLMGGVPAHATTPFAVTLANSGTTAHSFYFTKATATVIWKRTGSTAVINVKP